MNQGPRVHLIKARDRVMRHCKNGSALRGGQNEDVADATAFQKKFLQ